MYLGTAFKRYGLTGVILLGLSLSATAFSDDEPAASQELTHKPKKKTKQHRLQQVIRQTLVENPEIIEEAIQALQKKRERNHRKLQAKAVKKAWGKVYEDQRFPILGNPAAPYTVVGFYDLRCGHCHSMLVEMADYVKHHSDVRLIIRDFPFLSDASKRLGELSLLAQRRGKFEDFIEAALGLEGQVDVIRVNELAKQIGLNAPVTATENAEIQAALEATKSLASDLDINSTPTFIIGSTIYDHYEGIEALDALITKKLRKGTSGKDAVSQAMDPIMSHASESATPTPVSGPLPDSFGEK